MVISHNLTAMNASRMLGISTNSKSKSTEKLSSGYKINRAADDAAGLAISEKMRRQIRGLKQGVTNTQDGVSMLQVGDGALSEVSDMLHRLEELSVKSANGTNSYEDRNYIQEEIDQIISEIDRIGDTTTFNDVYLFKGRNIEIYTDNGAPVTAGSIPVSDYSLSSVGLGISPFGKSARDLTNPDTLRLSTVISNGPAAGIEYSLIYGNGNTSKSSVYLTDENGHVSKIGLSAFTVDPDSYKYDETTKEWSRTMNYNKDGINLSLEQIVKAVDNGTTEKYFDLSYELTNNSDNKVNALFMFNADTAYGGNHSGDLKETYFINNKKVSKNTVYSTDDSPLTNKALTANAGSGIKYETIPSSFSIINAQDQDVLSFSEKISLPDKTDVVDLTIGRWTLLRNWDLYNDSANHGATSTLMSSLLQDITGKDLEFNIVFNMGELTKGSSKKESFHYGIESIVTDQNINGLNLNLRKDTLTKHEAEFPIWIQSGCEAYDGINITFAEMNARVLDIHDMDVTSDRTVQFAIDQVKSGLQYVSRLRSNLGAQQNRLEHTINNENNIVENTTAAESQIRDTDMADEMINFSNLNIIQQTGQSVLAQANQSKQGILSLLQ